MNENNKEKRRTNLDIGKREKTKDYKESLIIDRKTETIEQIQNIGSGCIVSRKF